MATCVWDETPVYWIVQGILFYVQLSYNLNIVDAIEVDGAL